MKVEFKEEIRANQLSVGEMGRIVHSEDDDFLIGHVILRTYSGFVDLHDPIRIWTETSIGNELRCERKEFKLVEV